MNSFKKVYPEEFFQFINGYDYPNYKPEMNISEMFDPPIQSYNDFRLGSWPQSVIAYIKRYGDYDPKEANEYYILDV